VLSKAFGHVFVVPGNHDLWCRKVRGRGGTAWLGGASMCVCPPFPRPPQTWCAACAA
jgi:hypothetical protein